MVMLVLRALAMDLLRVAFLAIEMDHVRLRVVEPDDCVEQGHRGPPRGGARRPDPGPLDAVRTGRRGRCSVSSCHDFHATPIAHGNA